MARPHRILPAGVIHHVMNRGSRKGVLFNDRDDYLAFERLLSRAREMFLVRIIAYCLMSNHWHLLLCPQTALNLSRFMKWVTGTHATTFRRKTNTVGQGAVYQARFLALPIEGHFHLVSTWRYIERNPVEARVVKRAEDWRWSSASLLKRSCQPARSRPLTMDPPPERLPSDWLKIVNGSFDELVLKYMSHAFDPEVRVERATNLSISNEVPSI